MRWLSGRHRPKGGKATRVPSKDEGFTLVELMVVVLIIGVLVAIAIPVFNSASDTTRVKTCQGNLRTLEGAVEQCLATDPACERADCDDTGWVTELFSTGKFLKEEPTCPTAGSQYMYDAVDLQAACGIPVAGGGLHPRF